MKIGEYRKLLLKYGVTILRPASGLPWVKQKPQDVPSKAAVSAFCAAVSKHLSQSARNAVQFGRFDDGSRAILVVPPVDEVVGEIGQAATKAGRKARLSVGDIVVAPRNRVGVVREIIAPSGKRRAFVLFAYGDGEYPSGYEQHVDEGKLLLVARG